LVILISNVYEDIDHVNSFFMTGPRAMYVVHSGDLVPVDTMLVTPV